MKRFFCIALLFFVMGFAPVAVIAQPSQSSANTTSDPTYYLKAVLHYGGSFSWTTAVQNAALDTYLAGSTPEQQIALCVALATAQTDAAKVFALKSFLTGDRDLTVLKGFIEKLNALSETEQQQLCSVLQPKGWIQKWQYSCSIAVVVNYLMELSPRYAFEMKQVSGWDNPSSDAANETAKEERRIFEQYGGVASPRGDMSGKAIGILYPLNDLVGKLLGVQFTAEQITGTQQAGLAQIRSLLQTGMNVPVLLDLLPSRAAHFVLFFRAKQEGGQWQYQVYDPWEGKCEWVTEATITAGSLAPILSSHSIQLTYYYPSAKL